MISVIFGCATQKPAPKTPRVLFILPDKCAELRPVAAEYEKILALPSETSYLFTGLSSQEKEQRKAYMELFIKEYSINCQ